MIAYMQFQQQQRASRDLLISNQISKGFEQLASSNLQLRLGGIYALEGVMNTSEQYYKPILETLCAFVRDGTQTVTVTDLPPPATDIQAALTVIGRRAAGQETPNLGNAHILKVDLTDANLDGAIFENTNLYNARLTNANLAGALLGNADLSWAFLSKANLAGAHRDRARARPRSGSDPGTAGPSLWHGRAARPWADDQAVCSPMDGGNRAGQLSRSAPPARFANPPVPHRGLYLSSPAAHTNFSMGYRTNSLEKICTSLNQDASLRRTALHPQPP